MIKKTIPILLILTQLNCILTSRVINDASTATRYIKYSIKRVYKIQIEENNLIIQSTISVDSEKNKIQKHEEIEYCFKHPYEKNNQTDYLDTSKYRLCKERKWNHNFQLLDYKSGYLFINNDLILKSDDFPLSFCNCKNFPKEKTILHILKNYRISTEFNAEYIFIFTDYSAYVIPSNEEIRKIDPKLHLINIPFEQFSNYFNEECIYTGICTFDSIKKPNKSITNKISKLNPFLLIKPETEFYQSSFIAFFNATEFNKKIINTSHDGYFFKYYPDDEKIDKGLKIIFYNDHEFSFEDSGEKYKYLLTPFTIVADIILTPIAIVTSSIAWALIAFQR
ncbi:hypothetical protein [Leptospira bouyouniensis]|uniref:hypothetical protein n=1 Tax=Leptospira bouyouniensis TaxID=2484911 RepID=UPI0010913AF6|nr:hypothetical protein [Leptospira bouyouniensis]TGM88706.1 hypothetical protein EHQ99_00060 [Leptospira bouyouniensis]